MAYNHELVYKTRLGANGEQEPHESKRKLFISYRKKDNLYDLRDRIADYILEAVDCAVWYDKSLTPGENYDDEIYMALQDCDVMILLLTPHVLESAYIWQIEVKNAIKLKKCIIPLSLGFPAEELDKITAILGHIHIIAADNLAVANTENGDYKRFAEEMVNDLRRAINRYLVNQDIAKKVSSFFAAEKNKLPFKTLTVEQLYLLAYGLLNGIGTDANTEKAVDLLTSLVTLYCDDRDTTALKGEIAHELMLYYCKMLNREMAIKLALQAAQYDRVESLNYLGELFSKGELFPRDSDKAKELFQLGVDRDNLPAIHNLIKLVLTTTPRNKKQEAHAQLLPYYEKGALLGDLYDILSLLATYWNLGRSGSITAMLCHATFGQYPEISCLCQALPYIPQGTMYAVKPKAKTADIGEFLGEKELQGHTYTLYKKRIGDFKTLVSFVVDNARILHEEECAFYGGDGVTFDFGTDDNGFIYLKISDFDHYGAETIFDTRTFLTPLSDAVAVVSVLSDWLRGKRMLPYSGYVSG